MDFRSQTALLAAIVTLALGVSVLLRPRRKVLTLFAVLCLTYCLFEISEFLAALDAPGPWSRAAFALGCFVPAAAYPFFVEFLGVVSRNARRARLLVMLGAMLGLGVAISPLGDSQLARGLALAWTFIGLLMSFSLLLQRMASAEARIERTRMRYLVFGAGIVIAASAFDALLFSWPVRFPPIGAIAATFYLFLLAQTLQRLRLLDVHELLGKTLAVTLHALIIAAIFFVLVYWVGERPGLFVFNALIASIVVLILFEPLRAKADEWIVATMFRERFEMIRALQALKARLDSVIEVHEMAKIVLDALHETRRVTHACVYLLSDDRPGFWLLDSRGPAPAGFVDAAAARPLITLAFGGQKAVLLENVERRLAEARPGQQDSRRSRDETKRLTDLKNVLKQMNAGIAVPLMGGERVIGFLGLQDERVPEAYASDEIAMILEIAERVATIVENSKLYERMKERDRLAALGEMAAGLAHEIRNPLGAIKGAAQYLSPERLPPDDGEFLGVIVEEVNRLNTVVTHFLDYSRPLKQNFAPTDLADVLQRTVKLLSNDIPSKVAVQLHLGDQLPKVQADPEQLKQVLINLLQNAVQAMPDGGTITLAASCPEVPPWRLSDLRDSVEVRVRDTGSGIPEEARQHMFVPFYTTKEKGTGLGLAICQRIVKNHGGSISLTSKVGEGTEFVIRLPAIPEPRQTELFKEEGTPSPDLTPYPGTLAPPRAIAAGARRRDKKPRPSGTDGSSSR